MVIKDEIFNHNIRYAIERDKDLAYPHSGRKYCFYVWRNKEIKHKTWLYKDAISLLNNLMCEDTANRKEIEKLNKKGENITKEYKKQNIIKENTMIKHEADDLINEMDIFDYNDFIIAFREEIKSHFTSNQNLLDYLIELSTHSVAYIYELDKKKIMYLNEIDGFVYYIKIWGGSSSKSDITLYKCDKKYFINNNWNGDITREFNQVKLYEIYDFDYRNIFLNKEQEKSRILNQMKNIIKEFKI